MPLLDLAYSQISNFRFLGGRESRWSNSDWPQKPEVVFNLSRKSPLPLPATISCLIFGGAVGSGSRFSVGGLSAGSRVSANDDRLMAGLCIDVGGGIQSVPARGFMRRWRSAGRTVDGPDVDPDFTSAAASPVGGGWTLQSPVAEDFDESDSDRCGC